MVHGARKIHNNARECCLITCSKPEKNGQENDLLTLLQTQYSHVLFQYMSKATLPKVSDIALPYTVNENGVFAYPN